jgi:putative AlgH/UPF0301 family transcriptional regulator
MATLVRINRKEIATLLFGVAALWLSPAASGEHGERVTVLVANRGFTDAQYQQSVVVLQRGGDEEVGVIINRPTEHKLENVVALPAAEKAADPVYTGGPFAPQQLLALIRDEKSPGEGSMQLARGLHLSIGQGVLERAVERAPGTARFYAGLVLWRPGELEDEIKRGLWLKLEVPLDWVFLRDSTGLWEELLLAAQGLRI